jgi:hypothetical protein
MFNVITPGEPLITFLHFNSTIVHFQSGYIGLFNSSIDSHDPVG